MSERGSFCTEYISCDDCFEACKQVLLNKTKWLYSEQIGNHPIIAGKIGGMYSGEEFHDMENEYIPKIQKLMNDNCTIRICVHSDCNGSVIYEFDKDEIISECEVEDDN